MVTMFSAFISRKQLLFAVFLSTLFQSVWSQQVVKLAPEDCRPDVLRRPVVTGMSVSGDLSGFDPCHPSVTFTVPSDGRRAPVVLSVHGGGGRSDADAITREFSRAGMATLIFDAYKLNQVPPRTGNAYRQMMLYKVALQAYEWLLARTEVDTERIYFYGISNGASVVLNLAAVVDPRRVKGVFSEAPTPVGIGYPWTLRVPVLLAFGQLDDLGARVGQKRWMISDPCRFTILYSEAPKGTAELCSQQNPNGTMLTTLQWAEKVRLDRDARLDIRYFDDVAHGAFLGPLKIQTAAQFAAGKGFQMPPDMGWSEGATDAGRTALLRDALMFFEVSSN